MVANICLTGISGGFLHECKMLHIYDNNGKNVLIFRKMSFCVIFFIYLQIEVIRRKIVLVSYE